MPPGLTDRGESGIQRAEQIAKKNGRFRIALSDSIPTGSQLLILKKTGDSGGFAVSRAGMDQGEGGLDPSFQLFRQLRSPKSAGARKRRDPLRFQDALSCSHGTYLSELDSFWAKRRRTARLSILPTGVFGSSPMKRKDLGILYEASLPLKWDLSPSSVNLEPSFGTTAATTASPHLGSGAPTTTACSTSGWSAMSCSTSAGYTFSPPVTIISFFRPTM